MNDISLHFVAFTPPNIPSKETTPVEYYDIISNKKHVGVLNFKIGQNDYLRLYAGHISFTVFENFRGKNFASKALSRILPHCLLFLPEIFITCDSENIASQKTIERVNPIIHSMIDVPKNNILYKDGYRKVRRYSVKR